MIGMYKGAAFKFTFAIEQDYPHKPPKVKCVPKVGVSVLFALLDVLGKLITLHVPFYTSCRSTTRTSI